ncbi:MAG: HAD family phosphatase [Planctomycetota bacterium]
MPARTPATARPAAVAFDLDGLLVNSEDVYQRVGSEILRRRGKRFEDPLRHAMLGRPAADALRVMIDWHALDDSVEDLARESEGVFWQLAAGELRCMPAAVDLLDWLTQRGAPRGVVTSGSRAYAAKVLELVGLAGRFAFCITADDVTHGKPAPEPYTKAAERFGVPPEAMLALEDSATGCRAAVAAGALTVAVPNRHTADHDFPPGVRRVTSLGDPELRRLLTGDGA